MIEKKGGLDMEKIILSLVVLNCLTNIFLAIAIICNSRDIAKLEARIVMLEFYQKTLNISKEKRRNYLSS